MTHEVKAAVLLNGHALTVPLDRDAQEALEDWLSTKTDEVAEILAPFGLHPFDIAAPRYRRIVTTDEIDVRT